MNSNIYMTELNTLFIDIETCGLNNIIYADMILNNTQYYLPDEWNIKCGKFSTSCQTQIQFINIICGSINTGGIRDQCDNIQTHQPTSNTIASALFPSIPPSQSPQPSPTQSPTPSPSFSPVKSKPTASPTYKNK
eukprot:417272_1